VAYRTPQLEIPGEDPFRHDKLSRGEAVDFVAQLIERAGGPFVVAVDGPWGTGKTTFIRMLQAVLRQANYQCVHFNAWEVDYTTDPLVAMVSAIDQIKLESPSQALAFRDRLKTIRKVTSLVAKRGAVAAVKALTVGALDLEEETEAAISEFAGDAIGDIVDAFQKERELLVKFRAELEGAITQLPASGKKPTLVFFVDELDRCRPTFAVELLERVKHLFGIANIVFVLAIDKAQLEASTAAIYGSRINAAEYLRRFIDIDFAIPVAKGKRHTEELMSSFELDELFSGRSKFSELRNDRDNFVAYFTKLADLFDLSLRARERCFTRMRLVMDQTPPDHYLDPVLVALLVVLRAKQPSLYANICRGHVSSDDVVAHLAALPGGQAFVQDHSGIVVEVFLMAVDRDQKRASAKRAELKRLLEDNDAPPDVRRRAEKIFQMSQAVPGPGRGGIDLDSIARKIDLAANVRD
jgi:hypothetical protein